MAEQRTYPEGVTSWIDVEAPDVEAAQRFYGELFGWTFHEATPPGSPFRYFIAQLDGQDAAGIGAPAEAGGGGADAAEWNTYVAVTDIAAATARVTTAGGRVVSEPTAAGEGGTAATCLDAAGASFRLWQANRRLGAQVANVPGAWNFANLRVSDTAAARAFYGEVFDWVIDDLGDLTMIRLPGYGDHLAATVDPGIYERQASVHTPPGFADVIGGLAAPDAGDDPHWHVAFTVDDRDETADAAQRLGGTVLSSAETDWTRDAKIRDPQGAVFTASQFTPPEG